MSRSIAVAKGTSPAASLTVNRRIGITVGERYKILSLLGEGAMGAVYLAEHIQIRKRVALKVLNPTLMENAELVARFEREALAAAHVDHPNVAAATDLGRTPDGALYLVLEYLEGQGLRDALSSPMAPARALHIAKQVAAALMRAHSVGIVHRDLKPENIMLVHRDGDPDYVKVLDFGLAKVSVETLLGGQPGVRVSEVLTRYGSVFGTPCYMSPEQSVGEVVDGRADLYALGIILYEMLTGLVPFDSEDNSAILRQHLMVAALKPSERAPGQKIPPQLDALVLCLLAKHPDQRPPDARALLSSLEQLIASEGLHHPPLDAAHITVGPKVTGRAALAATAAGQRPQQPTVPGLPRTAPGANLPKPPAAVPAPLTPLKPPVIAKPPAAAAAPLAPLEPSAVAMPDAATMAGPQLPGAGSEGLAEAVAGFKDLAPGTKPPAPAAAEPAPKMPAEAAGGSAAEASPLALALAVGAPPGPPELRVPSALNLDEVAADQALVPKVLTPDPPTSPIERLREATAAGRSYLRERAWPQLRMRGGTAFGRLLARTRSYLPPSFGRVSDLRLGLMAGGVLALPPLLLLFILFRSCGEVPNPTPSPSGGYASEQEMKQGVQQGTARLEVLALKYPSDARIHRAVVRAYAAQKNHLPAVRALAALLRVDPGQSGDAEMGQVVVAAAQAPESSEAALQLLEGAFGETGIDLLLALATGATAEPMRTRFAQSLTKPEVRARATPVTLLLLDLHTAARCEAKRALLGRAGQEGDQRVLAYLKQLQIPTGCGTGGRGDCYPCLRRGSALQNAITAIEKRGGSR